MTIMLAFLFVVALTTVDAANCTTIGALAPTNVFYGNGCNDSATSTDLGCRPSADCGYKYCCLSKTGISDPNGTPYCMPNAYAGVCAIPQVNSFYTACSNVTQAPGQGISSYGCPCDKNPNSCLGGYQCGIPPTTFSFYGNFPAAPALGYSGTGQYTVLSYNENVCWTPPLSYNFSNTSNYITPFGCTDALCGNSFKVQLPIFGVCSSTYDCQNTTNWPVPAGLTSGNPYRCDIHGTSQCQARASCDPVNHICQSRQFGDLPGNPSAPKTANSQIWFFNGGCSTC